MTDTTLIQRLQSAAHWHLTEGNGDDATHQALQDAAAALEQQAANLAYVKAASVFNLMEENKRQAAQIEALRADAERMRVVLRFYARGEHYHLDPYDEFDTVSGEPDDWFCSGRDDSGTMIETGGYARLALRGVTPEWVNDDGADEMPQPIDGEVLCAALRQEQPT